MATPVKRYFYNEEFDPGSGWTLATGLTHASRGAAWTYLAVVQGSENGSEKKTWKIFLEKFGSFK